MSHVLLGHTQAANEDQALYFGLQLVLLSQVDPSGLLSLIFEYLLNFLREVAVAKYSRNHEFEVNYSCGLESVV